MKKRNDYVNYLKKGETIDLVNLDPEILGIIGIELKRRRRKQSRTLDSFDCGCSISYISKIENGKITPKYSILQELCSEQGISQIELDALISVNNLLNDAISATFYKKYDLVKMYCEGIAHFDNYKVNLLKAIDYVNHNLWDEALKIIPTITIIEDKLVDADYNILLYLQMRIENHFENYLKAHSIYKQIKLNDNMIINTLCYHEYFYAICKCGFENPTHYYEKLCNMYLKLFNNNLNEINELYFKTLINLGCEVPQIVFDTFDVKNQIIYYIKHNKFKELLELKENNNLSSFEKMMIAMAVKDYIDVINQYQKIDLENLKEKEKIMCNYCRLLIEGNGTQIVNYANKVGLPYAEKRGDFTMLVHLVKSICEHSLTTGKYKNVATMCMSLFSFVEKYQKHYA